MIPMARSKNAPIDESAACTYSVVVAFADGAIGHPISPEIDDSYPTAEKAKSAMRKLLNRGSYSWNGAAVRIIENERAKQNSR